MSDVSAAAAAAGALLAVAADPSAERSIGSWGKRAAPCCWSGAPAAGLDLLMSAAPASVFCGELFCALDGSFSPQETDRNNVTASKPAKRDFMVITRSPVLSLRC